MVKNRPSNAGDEGSIPSQGSKIPNAARHLSLRNPSQDKIVCSFNNSHGDGTLDLLWERLSFQLPERVG